MKDKLFVGFLVVVGLILSHIPPPQLKAFIFLITKAINQGEFGTKAGANGYRSYCKGIYYFGSQARLQRPCLGFLGLLSPLPPQAAAFNSTSAVTQS